MPVKKNVFESEKFEFSDTSFNLLMQKRIHRVLLVCSNYDAFILEEDGRIDEQVFNEYVSLNLRYPPVFIQARSAQQAFDILENDQIDLIIEMLNIGDIDTFELAKKIKSNYSKIPIVVLTYFSREVLFKLSHENLSAIDYVFCWLGNPNLLLAIIKLIEDKMNAKHDVEEIGVQTLLLIEDSIRYISVYLPDLYKIVLQQSREFIKEALNEHQQMLRMRGRPKILLATNYEEAVALYNTYKTNLLGIISDVSFMRGDKKDTTAGMAFCKMVREEDKQMPFLLQSANPECEQYANDLNVGFINKYSKTLSIELKNYILNHFGFGDLIFRDPITHQEIGRAKDLPSLQQLILTIPDRTLLYHTSRNHISKWLNARALFPIARMFKYLQAEDFENLDELRLFVDKTISRYRLSKGRGVIAKFDRSNFNEYLIFSRIGEGSIGGKARGLAFINNIIKKYKLYNKYEDVLITIPQTIVLSTDVFDEFMESNNLYPVAMSNISDEEILQHFIQAKLSQSIQQDLYAYISVVENPIAVRSSSKLEDSHYQPFAGIYSTYMVPNIRADKALTIKLLCNAIKSVYASVFYKSSKAYITATSNAIDEEKMGIVLQEVCGTRYGNHFYPTISGVARSINFYPIGVEKLEEGTVNIAFGLGRFIVEGGNSLRFSPRYPQKVLQLSTPEMVLKQTQKQFYALDLSPEKFIPSTDDGVNLMKLSINEALNDKSFKMVTSTYDFQNNMVRESSDAIGKKVVTFSKILNHETFPLAKIISELMEIGQKEMNNPIEIEFAVNLDVDPGEPRLFNFLQIRPIVENDQNVVVKIDEVPKKETIIYSTSALGNGSVENIRDFIYVKPETFNPADNKQIALEIEKLNEQFVADETNYVLVGPGRWGSRDPWLGIPINWVQISQARVIVESGLRNFRIDPSQGTHFFQNLTSFRVGYFTINPYINEGYYDVDFLNQQSACYENDHLRHISFEKPLKILIDGRKNRGVIFKPTD